MRFTYASVSLVFDAGNNLPRHGQTG